MLGEFFAAKPGEIDEVLDKGPYGRFPTVEAKTVSSVSIATLGELLSVGTFDDLIELIEGPQAESGESGIDRVPEEMRDALASTPDDASVASSWATTDELVDWQPADVVQVVRELSRLAQQARDDGAQLWFWWSV